MKKLCEDVTLNNFVIVLRRSDNQVMSFEILLPFPANKVQSFTVSLIVLLLSPKGRFDNIVQIPIDLPYTRHA